MIAVVLPAQTWGGTVHIKLSIPNRRLKRLFKTTSASVYFQMYL
uniref:Uncharacterized protein n=1 Tax=Anguilla anguilla TaxID=7936 RepID=A0A0E9TUF6_ANGAN